MALTEHQEPGLDGMSVLDVTIGDTGIATFIIQLKDEVRPGRGILAAITLSPGSTRRLSEVLG